LRYSIRNILSTILTLLFSGQLCCQSLSDISFGTDSTFEVVSWNLEWFPKNGIVTVDSVSKIIESLDVDLLGLQEIDDTTICRQMINNISGYDLFMDDDWFGGLAYVYKTSSINIQSIYKIYDTSPFWNAFPRSPLVMELTYMGEEFIVINNHFKCCGDGVLDIGNSSDEETRRYEASSLLKQYIDINFPSSRVIVMGDLNDILTDGNLNNVFQLFIDDPTNYLFADETIANGSTADWSFPGWPSHLDHILITNELFSEFSNTGSVVQTIKVDDFMSGGLVNYDYYISDHRPVGLKIKVIPTMVSLVEVSYSNIEIFPNPTNGHLSIDLTQYKHATALEIIDINGKVIHSMLYQENQLIDLNIEGPSGIYLLTLESGNNKSVTRLIKK
jgi:endonuclease/exonuclease/phosphatase family metal-dependent hydrolase